MLRLIEDVRARDVAVVLITHNAFEAPSVGDRFAVLAQGGVVVSKFCRGKKDPSEVIILMAGGRAFEELQSLREDSNRGHESAS